MHEEFTTGRPGDEVTADIPPLENSRRIGQARRLSEVIDDLGRNASGPVSIATIRDALGDRSFAALLVFFSAINLLPLPPGTTLILGLPLILVSAQMVVGKTSAWLPRFVLDKSLNPAQFRRLSGSLVPRLQKLERFVQPRYWPFYPSHDERVIGLLALIMGITVTLPIPFGNWFPALSTTLLGLALSERDGLILGVAVTIGVLALCLVAFVIGSAAYAVHIVA
jgi:hypothetical protein